MIKSRAAVAFEAKKPLEIVEVDVAMPKAGEVLLRVVASGVCHTDAYTLSGADPEGIFPSILGHEGGAVVEEVRCEGGKIWINKSQYFDVVPEVAWDFYIGGYQPAQKWLKDRKGRELSFGDIKHYQRILKVLAETDRIMGLL